MLTFGGTLRHLCIWPDFKLPSNKSTPLIVTPQRGCDFSTTCDQYYPDLHTQERNK
jgi:hypothetical protein